MSLGRSADDASILQREYSRWDSHGQYTVIICLRYYPSIQVLDKLTQFEALTVEDMEKSLSKCCTRNDRIWIKDVYSDRLFTIRKSIAEIKSNLIFSNYSKLAGLLFEAPPFLCPKTRKDVTKCSLAFSAPSLAVASIFARGQCDWTLTAFLTTSQPQCPCCIHRVWEMCFQQANRHF